MSDWYYLKHRKPVPYGCDILTNPVQYIKLAHKHFEHKRRKFRIRSRTIGELWISTVFLGLDHSFMGGDPMLFETIIFKNGEQYGNCDRCSTHREALKQHQAALKQVKAGLKGGFING